MAAGANRTTLSSSLAGALSPTATEGQVATFSPSLGFSKIPNSHHLLFRLSLFACWFSIHSLTGRGTSVHSMIRNSLSSASGSAPSQLPTYGCQPWNVSTAGAHGDGACRSLSFHCSARKLFSTSHLVSMLSGGESS